MRAADEAHEVGPAPARESYLRGERIAALAREIGADAIHPGYGFLSENAAFAEQCTADGLVWIGPPADVIRRMGDKVVARRTMQQAGVPVVPGATERLDDGEVLAAARRLGFPVLVKATGGGGGSGMRPVGEEGQLAAALARARSEAGAAFGDDGVYVERLVEGARHVEVQLLADAHGTRAAAVRARLLGAAPPPEAARGGAGAGRRRRLSRALDLRDKETEDHTPPGTDITLRLASALGVAETEMIHIRRGAILHDIGKVAIPDQILFKRGPLEEEEWKIMRKHPNLAVELLSPVTYLNPALEIPHWHHEKWDGSGYPDELAGERIPFSARLFAFADVYDALTSNRTYRPAWRKKDAVEYIESQSGKHFDPKIMPVFMGMLQTGAI